MISIRQSNVSAWNTQLIEQEAKTGETNRAWLKRLGLTHGIVLLGGASVAHFRIRTAQSHARADLAPSYWSVAGLLTGAETFLSVPLELAGDASEIAQRNGIRECRMADYDHPGQFPNIAAFHLTDDDKKIVDYAQRVVFQRNIVDIPALMISWLGFIWGVGEASNPIVKGLGLPSAAFLETVYSIGGVELTPGLASANSCPEAIWQAARWWHEFYEAEARTVIPENAVPHAPRGAYAIRQVAAAVAWPPEITDWSKTFGRGASRSRRRRK